MRSHIITKAKTNKKPEQSPGLKFRSTELIRLRRQVLR
ncbi:hypothetical protein CEV32_4879 [Brucella rhizosphaerae]|uniref:Uncharacterized protein n=1 Tax=Brucella rhizosphaerae TaxID=571254 RepID=A0A256FL78_9HYPH|nr:hypothetical protein CEV32_4879 [Brucella rhizosphaerae]